MSCGHRSRSRAAISSFSAGTCRTSPELAVSLDELERIERIIARLLLLAKAESPDFLIVDEVDVEQFLEDVFMRWSEIAPRSWRLGQIARGQIWADAEAVRIALDALLENAVKYTEPHETIELRAIGLGDDLVIEVADEGSGVPPDALSPYLRAVRPRGRRPDAHRTAVSAWVSPSSPRSPAPTAGRAPSSARAAGAVFVLRLPGFRPLTAGRASRCDREARHP